MDELAIMHPEIIRFPVERVRRPSYTLLREVAPGRHEMESLAEAFQFEPVEIGYRDEIDRMIADQIAAAAIPTLKDEWREVLSRLAGQAVKRAVIACGRVRTAWDTCYAASLQANEARDQGRPHAAALQARADGLAEQAARASLTAYRMSEAAEGISRAIRFALHGQAWEPRDHHQDATALFQLGQRSQPGR
jgi:hypothetical protein